MKTPRREKPFGKPYRDREESGRDHGSHRKDDRPKPDWRAGKDDRRGGQKTEKPSRHKSGAPGRGPRNPGPKPEPYVPAHEQEMDRPEGIRLNKAMAEAGVASRRNADELISAGRVKVNGAITKDLSTRVKPHDKIELDGEPIGRQERRRYILLNKPKDTITTTSDDRGRKTVLDLIGAKERLFPVGRLDRNTTGVLLLTNDGDLAFRLTHPRYEVEREYEALLDRELDLSDAKAIAAGVQIGPDERSQPCIISVNDKNGADVQIVIREGKNREVRRMFESRGYRVEKLNRIAYAGVATTGLRRGEWRELNREEVRQLRSKVKLDRR